MSTDTEIDFKINIPSYLANSLRRIMISKIPSIVINNVCIKENDSNWENLRIRDKFEKYR